MECLVHNSISIDNCPERYLNMREKEIARRKKLKLPMNLNYNQVCKLMDPFFSIYFCKIIDLST